METGELNIGIEACIQNAKRLFDDAQFLFNAERYAGSVFFGLTSMEESVKAMKLNEYKLTGKELTKSQWERNFLSHWNKLAESMKKRGARIDEEHPIVKGTYSSPSFVEWFAEEHNKLREYSLYVDRDFDNSEWKVPFNNGWLDKGWTQYILDGAKTTIELAEEEYANS